ncbi:MAG TPA: GAF and ANTAR domain-containing protein [Streptosporangiaceae bacterium]
MTAADNQEPVRQAVGSTGQRAAAGVARELSELAREMQADTTNTALLHRIVAAAVTEVSGAQYAGITLVTGKKLSTPAATDKLVERIDQIQYETGQGPCLEAASRHETVRSDDLRTETRWPQFTRQTVDLGVLSMMSFQLFVEAESFGALNFYGSNTGAFGPDSESTGMLLASHAALAMAAARTQEGLLAAMENRDLIGQAKGILIERYKIDEVQAFGLLVASSQAVNRKLREVAEHLVATGELLTPSS